MISVGIDVSKKKSTVCIMDHTGKTLRAPFDIRHTVDDLDKLVSLVESYNTEARVVLEATGHYHLPVTNYLVKSDIYVSCINALQMKMFSSQNLRRAKTDNIDSRKIAEYGTKNWYDLKPYYQEEEKYGELRMLSRQYDKKTELIVTEKVNLTNILDMVMPGIKLILSDEKLLEFAEKYIHYENIIKMGEKKFSAHYCKWANKKGYRMNERKASEIYASAQNGIPVLPNTPSTKIVVREAIHMIFSIEKSRNTILTQMKELCNTIPEYEIVKDMPSVGEITGAKLIAEVGDIHRFHSKHALIAYAGIDVPPYDSGEFSANNRKITKRGNSYLRKIGYQIILSVIRNKSDKSPVYEYYTKKRNEGKPAKKAMIAALNKLLRIYYGKASELYSIS